MRKFVRGPRNKYMFHQMNFDAGDRYTGSFWNNGKRETLDAEAEAQVMEG
jgi:hypothetical protein